MATQNKFRLVAHIFLGTILFSSVGAAGWLVGWNPIYGFVITISFLGGWFLGLNWLGPDLADPESRMSDRWKNFEVYDGFCIDLGGAWEIYRAVIWAFPHLNWPFIDGLLKIACLILYFSFISLTWILFLVAPFGVFVFWLILNHPLQCCLFFLGMELSNCMERLLDQIERPSYEERVLKAKIELIRKAIALTNSKVIDGFCCCCNQRSEEMKSKPFNPALHAPDCKVVALRRYTFLMLCEVQRCL